MLKFLKNNWYIVLAVVIFVFMLGLGVFNTLRQRVSAPTFEEEGTGEIVVEEDLEEATPGGEATAAAEPELRDAIEVADQLADSEVTVDLVELSSPGYAVIHEDADGKPGAVVGFSELLPKGVSEEVLVELNRALEEGERFFAMLHRDDGDLVFAISNDEPVLDEEGTVVMMAFEITPVPAEIENSL